MGRSILLALTAAALLALSPAVAAAQPAHAAKHRKSKCRRLKGKDLAPAKKVRLVERKNHDDGKDLLGCMLPKGKVRKIASSADFYTTVDSYSVRQVAGRIVLLDSGESSQYVYTRSTWAYDIRTDRSYRIAETCSMTGDPPEASCAAGGKNTTAESAFVNSLGQAAAAIEGTDHRVTIAGFTSKGARTDLDSGTRGEIAADSLHLEGSHVTWTHSGEQRSADISEPQAHAAKHKKSRCGRLKGKDLAPSKKVKVVRRKLAGGGDKLYGCVLPKGKVRLIALNEGDDNSEDSYSIRRIVGAIVLFDNSSSNKEAGGSTRSTVVYDVRTGHSYDVASSCSETVQGYCDRPRQDTRAIRTLVNHDGQAAAALTTGGGNDVTIAGFTSKGARTVFDSGSSADVPPDSLALEGRHVTWTHSGQTRSADIAK